MMNCYIARHIKAENIDIDMQGCGAYAEKWFINSDGSKTLYQRLWCSEYGLVDSTYSVIDPKYKSIGIGSKLCTIQSSTSLFWQYNDDGKTVLSFSYGTSGGVRNPKVEIKLFGDWRTLDGNRSDESQAIKHSKFDCIICR